MGYKKPTIHNSPEWKDTRKAFQGINSTPKKALEKSKRRVAEKMEKRSKKAGFYVHGHKNLGDVYEK